MDNEVIKLFKKNKSRHTVIVALFKGKKLPKYCTSMPRNPKPKINFVVKNLSGLYFSTIKKNSSTEDGAILIQLYHNTPILRGFSYRLYPPPLKVSRLKNMGSGYNSAVDFSGVKSIICVYFINKNGVIKFVDGKSKILLKIRGNKRD
jgi:hypothetical protein